MFDRELYDAANKGESYNVRYYLDNGANPNAIIRGETSMHAAAYNLHIGAMTELLRPTNQIRGNIFKEDNDGGNVLHKTASVICGTSSILISKKAKMMQLFYDIDHNIINSRSARNGETPIYWAIDKDAADSIRILRALGANCQIKYNDESPNQKAERVGNDEVKQAMMLNIEDARNYYHSLIFEYDNTPTAPDTSDETKEDSKDSLPRPNSESQIMNRINELEEKMSEQISEIVSYLDIRASRIEDNLSDAVTVMANSINTATHDGEH